jgi:hypothetical protein
MENFHKELAEAAQNAGNPNFMPPGAEDYENSPFNLSGN